MFERRTFIVRCHASPQEPILEDVATGECVRLPDLASIAGEIERRSYTGDTQSVAGQQDGTAGQQDGTAGRDERP